MAPTVGKVHVTHDGKEGYSGGNMGFMPCTYQEARGAWPIVHGYIETLRNAVLGCGRILF